MKKNVIYSEEVNDYVHHKTNNTYCVITYKTIKRMKCELCNQKIKLDQKTKNILNKKYFKNEISNRKKHKRQMFKTKIKQNLLLSLIKKSIHT